MKAIETPPAIETISESSLALSETLPPTLIAEPSIVESASGTVSAMDARTVLVILLIRIEPAPLILLLPPAAATPTATPPISPFDVASRVSEPSTVRSTSSRYARTSLSSSL